MGFEDMLGAKFWIKFTVLIIPFVLFIFNFAPDIKWKIVLSLGGVIGIITALTGKGLRRRD